MECCCLFKQKTGYECRISDWSSGVCSSDLRHGPAPEFLRRRAVPQPSAVAALGKLLELDGRTCVFELLLEIGGLRLVDAFLHRLGRRFDEILGPAGKASCGVLVGQFV